MKRGFSHVVVYTKDELQWMRLNPGISKLDWEILPDRSDDRSAWRKYHPASHALYIRSGILQSYLGQFGFSNCVKLAQYLCGIKIRAYTPWKLYKKLTKISKSNKPLFNVFEIRVLA